ncbi:hypothetical protein OIO90_001711 [Microbotryomycetes sp. JL221]|nr:hypothetical protein OIO90_001711 [Microbotryomycetes sp. JL221]
MGVGLAVANEWRECRDASKELGSFVRHHDWKRSIKNSFRRKYWIWWIITIILIVLFALLAIYQDPIVKWFEPRRQDILDTPGSWAVPIAALVILSFPPLGGHEIIILVCGLIWGLWIGFALVSAGTFLGEMACYIMFRYFFKAKAQKYATLIEQKSIFYACVARMMREGGIWILVVVRFSAIPANAKVLSLVQNCSQATVCFQVVTAMQSTIGVGVLKYAIAVIITLPKQLAIVYLGVMFGETDATEDEATVAKQRKITLGVLFVTAIMTMLALYIVYMRARRLYPQILLEQKARLVLDGQDGGNNNEDLALGRTTSFEVLRVRKGGLVEATMDGDVGPFADAPMQYNPEYSESGDVNYGGKRPSKGDIGHSMITMVPSRTSSARESTPWNAIEERERREATITMDNFDQQQQQQQHLQQQQQGGHTVYGPMQGDRTGAHPSFTHLPLQPHRQ